MRHVSGAPRMVDFANGECNEVLKLQGTTDSTVPSTDY